MQRFQHGTSGLLQSAPSPVMPLAIVFSRLWHLEQPLPLSHPNGCLKGNGIYDERRDDYCSLPPGQPYPCVKTGSGSPKCTLCQWGEGAGALRFMCKRCQVRKEPCFSHAQWKGEEIPNCCRPGGLFCAIETTYGEKPAFWKKGPFWKSTSFPARHMSI